MLERMTDPSPVDETRIDAGCARWPREDPPARDAIVRGRPRLVNGSPAKPSTKVRARRSGRALIADASASSRSLRPIGRVSEPLSQRPVTSTTAAGRPEAGPRIRPAVGRAGPARRLRPSSSAAPGADGEPGPHGRVRPRTIASASGGSTDADSLRRGAMTAYFPAGRVLEGVAAKPES